MCKMEKEGARERKPMFGALAPLASRLVSSSRSSFPQQVFVPSTPRLPRPPLQQTGLTVTAE